MLDCRPASVASVSPAAKGAPPAQREGDLEIGVDEVGGREKGGDARQNAVGARLDARPAGRAEGTAGEIAEAGQVFGKRPPRGVASRGAQSHGTQAARHGRRAA